MRRLVRHVRQPAPLLMADGLLESEGTSISPAPRAFARSRTGDLGTRASGTAASEPGSWRASRRGVSVAHRPGPPCSHTRARAVSAADCRRGLALRRQLARPPFGSPGRRSRLRLTPERARVSSRSAGNRRAPCESARSTDRRRSEPVEREAVHACLRRRGHRGAARRTRRKACSCRRLKGAPEAGPTDTSRKKTPVSRPLEVAEAGSAP
jgi:hypothetical protein